LYTISPQGENTLTVRNGKEVILKALLKAERVASGTTLEDAETLARYNRLAARTVRYSDFVAGAIG
jgi:hypothetical protein